jgi:hypothetical protein
MMTDTLTIDAPVSAASFRDEWLRDVQSGSPSTVELGRRFAHKLITQWLEIDPSTEEIVYCDGAGDGGIDLAYLHRGEGQEGDGTISEGDTWYLVQSKYGAAFQGSGTILHEGQKVIDTLDGQRRRLSSLAEGLLERLTTFRGTASELDRIVLVFATEEPLDSEQTRTLADLRVMGRARLGPLFDVEAVSVDTIYQRTLDVLPPSRVGVTLKATLEASGEELLVGAVPLLNLYDFLKGFRTATGDLDQLYEKNVRRFLGSRGRVNKAMKETLRDTPERFGLYNNGITIVVEHFKNHPDGTVEMVEPYVVNGCQTTRTIWEVCHQRLESGGTGDNPALEEWRRKAAQGVVVAKIVKVGSAGEALLREITRYTNSQNAVREKDFLALTSDFKVWARQMGEQYGVYLEIQRGGWDSYRALMRQRPDLPNYEHYANAFDLMKVYGSGWLGEAGVAFGRNAAFTPGGSIFKRVLNGEESFGVEDVYAAYLLQGAADGFGFGRNAKTSRRQTRFLFYMVVMELLKGVLQRGQLGTSPKDLTEAVLALFKEDGEEARKALLDMAIALIDEYMLDSSENSVFKEPLLRNTFNNDLNGFLKAEQLGKSHEVTPNLKTLIGDYLRTMARPMGGTPSPQEAVVERIRAAKAGQ